MPKEKKAELGCQWWGGVLILRQGGKSALSEKVIALFFGYIVIFYVEPLLYIFALL